jgi:MerR family transcriptional regulator, light-induced transcriptional regulator
MQNKSSPKKLGLPQHIEAGSTDLRRPDQASDWAATLEDIHAQTSAHIALRNKPEDEKAKTFRLMLAAVVEGQVIPRLMLAHKSANIEKTIDTAALIERVETAHLKIDPAIIEPFTALVLSGGVEDLEDFVVDMTVRGITTHDIYLDLMAPTARLLGQYWEDDICSFTDVTMGLGKLQTLLYRLSASHPPPRPHDASPSALFLTPEGSQHSLGIRMVEELFRDAGWRTICEINTPLPTLIDLVQQDSFDIIGISLSAQGQVEQTRFIIEKLREASQNPAVQIVVGGKLILDDPNLAQRLGADLSARDGKEAIVIATKLSNSHQHAH